MKQRMFLTLLLICIGLSTAFSQGLRTVSGVVYSSDDKQPIIGASVLVKGTTLGATTNLDGKFTIKQVPQTAKTIVVSFVGMKSQEIAIQSEEMKITLSPDNEMLDEVVVTGYQKINRKMFTGSASKLEADKTLLKGSPDLTSSLQGKVSGVSLTNVSGSFGASPVLTIRGNSSINGSNKPLWVVDGVVLEDLVPVSADDLTSGNLSTLLSSGVAGINPEDIASIEVLKDVSATSLYGAQAMNGVIVITTKQGKNEKLQVSYSGSVSFENKPSYRDFNIMTSRDEMSIYRELYDKGWINMSTIARAENYGVMGKMFNEIKEGHINWGPYGSLNTEFLNAYSDGNTDWFKTLFHDKVINMHSVSISGGSKVATYYASLGYYGDDGMAVTSDYVNRYTATLRGKYNLAKNFSAGIKLSTSIRDQRVPGASNREFNTVTGQYNRDFDINPYTYALYTSRNMRPYDENGKKEFFRRNFADFNILHELDHNFVDVSVQDISTQLDLEYKPLKNLTFNMALQYRTATTLQEHKIHEKSNRAEAYRANYSQTIIDNNKYLYRNADKYGQNPYSILPEGGFYNTEESQLNHIYMRTTMDYSPKMPMNHVMNIFAGMEMNRLNRSSRGNDGFGYLYDKGGISVTHPEVMDYLSKNGEVYYFYNNNKERRISMFTNIAYSYAGKYIVNAGFRYDGSNQLGKSRTARYLPSWNFSGAWNMQEEKFMKNLTFINVLKPKFSYGYNGIMGPASSAELAIYSARTVRPTDNEVYNRIARLQNDDLTWEKMYELNLGLEAAFLNNRISFEMAHYRRKSIDLIDVIQTSGIGGEGRKIGNIGNMKSHGWEFTIQTTNIATKSFKWNTSLNLNFHKSEITKLNNFARFSQALSPNGVAMLGFPQRGIFSTRFAGLDKQGIPTFYGENNEVVYDMNLQSYKDVDKILKYEGTVEPRSYGGMTNTLTYKNWSLNIGLVYKWGNVLRLNDAFYPYYDDYSSFPTELNDRWRVAGDEKRTTIPAILDKRTVKFVQDKNAYHLYNKSTERIAKGDFIRLKDVTLTYSLPQRWLQKTFIKMANLSVQGTNLWLIYSDKKLHGLDPEFYMSGGVSMPVNRKYTFTLNLQF